jgi:hypothetical protein
MGRDSGTRGLWLTLTALATWACGGGGAGTMANETGPAEVEALEALAEETPPDPCAGYTLAGLTGADGVVTLEYPGWAGALRYDPATGLFGLSSHDADGPVLAAAESRVRFTRNGQETVLGSSAPGTRTVAVRCSVEHLPLLGLEATFTPAGEGPTLVTRFTSPVEFPHWEVTLEARWPAAHAQGVRVTRLSPVVADGASGGGLFLAPDPASMVVLDNGHDLYFDYEARVMAVGRDKSLFFPPGTASNWSIAVVDPAQVDQGSDHLVAGFLTSERGVGILGLDYQADKAPVLEGSQPPRRGFTRFEALTHYQDRGSTPRGDGDVRALTSETLWLTVNGYDPVRNLERLAQAIAAAAGKTLPTQVPSGWNSWGGGSGPGAYGADIDLDLMVENLEYAAADWLPWGMAYFMVDDGWQKDKGDWVSHPERFPTREGKEGMAWLADRVREKGMIPGLWISPFSANPGSELAQAHPDWFVQVTGIGVGMVGDELVLDLSRPEVLDWLEALFKRITQDWGYKWIKLDFSYYALFAVNLHDPAVTPSEAYKQAIRRVRQAIGPDVFLCSIAAQGLWLGQADGHRITLDNQPVWGDGPGESQSIKVTYKTVAHRWWQNHRAVINHPDLLFFREVEGLDLEEARAFTSAVALTGGIVKLGEPYVALHEHPEWRRLVYPLLPVYPHSAEPLDVFRREYPEVWRLDVEREGRQWAVLGVFNWGRNRDVGAQDFEAEAPRTLKLRLEEDLGLSVGEPGHEFVWFDAWRHESNRVPAGATLEFFLQPRRGTVLIVREESAQPFVLFTTRHLLGGAVEVHDERFDAASGKLEARLDTVPGEPITVWVEPAGRQALDAAASDALDLQLDTQSNLAGVTFTPTRASTLVRLSF